MQIIAVFFLVSVAIGGVAYVFIYPYLSGERKAEQRMQSVAKTEPLSRVTRGPQKSRRDLVETSLKDFDERTRKAKAYRQCRKRRKRQRRSSVRCPLR